MQNAKNNATSEALEACLEIMLRAFPSGLPIQQGTLCEEEDWNTAVRKAKAALGIQTMMPQGDMSDAEWQSDYSAWCD